MPADHGLRPDDLQSVQHAGCEPIQPGKYQTVDAAEGQSLRRFTSQHVELMTKRQDLCLQRRSRAPLAEVFRENAFIDLTNISIFGIDDLSAARIRDLSEQHVAFRGRNLPFLL